MTIVQTFPKMFISDLLLLKKVSNTPKSLPFFYFRFSKRLLRQSYTMEKSRAYFNHLLRAVLGRNTLFEK